jgi:enoyl-CoA hydratase/carnithine racemase
MSFKIEREPLKGGGVLAIATLNRPSTMNAMTMEDMPQGVQEFNKLAADPEVRVVIITGAGKAFTAGADLKVAAQIFQGKASPTDPLLDVCSAIERIKVPIIGAINGPAITGGFEIALACDILIASPNALFVDTHAKFGIHPCWGLSQKLQRLIGVNRARHFSLAAEPITAEQAEKWGIVSALHPAEKLMAEARILANKIGSNHPKLVVAYKKIIADGGASTLGDARVLERETANEYYQAMTPADFKAMQVRFLHYCYTDVTLLLHACFAMLRAI